MLNFRALEASPLDPHWPPAAGGSAPKPKKSPPQLRISGYAPGTRAANSNLNLKKVGCFPKLEKHSVDSNFNQVRLASNACLAARRILHISAVIPHFGYKYSNVIPHKTPKI